MIGAVVGLMFAAGALLLADAAAAATGAERARRRTAAADRFRRKASAAPAGALAATGAAAVALVATGLPSAALVAALAGAAAPAVVERRRWAGRERQLVRAWPDAIDMLGASVRAGAPLGEALLDLADRGPREVRPALSHYSAAYLGGQGVSESLAQFRRACAHPTVDRIVITVAHGHRSGGPQVLGMLATLSEFLRADARMRAEIEARQSWTVSAARLAVVAPWAALLILSAQEAASGAFAGPIGTALILATAAITAVAYMLMRRISTLPTSTRFEELVR